MLESPTSQNTRARRAFASYRPTFVLCVCPRFFVLRFGLSLCHFLFVSYRSLWIPSYGSDLDRHVSKKTDSGSSLLMWVRFPGLTFSVPCAFYAATIFGEFRPPGYKSRFRIWPRRSEADDPLPTMTHSKTAVETAKTLFFFFTAGRAGSGTQVAESGIRVVASVCPKLCVHELQSFVMA